MRGGDEWRKGANGRKKITGQECRRDEWRREKNRGKD